MTPSLKVLRPAAPLSCPSRGAETPPDDTSLSAFATGNARPKATFPLVLASVTIAVLSMSMDAVPRYSESAFFVGIALTIALAMLVGKVVDILGGSPWRLAASLLLPTAFGALIGMVVQAIVLSDVGSSWSHAVRDLGGLVDTTAPIPWIASGIVLGGLPALLVSIFLGLASRAIRRLTGHDASEGFGVAFTGGSGLLAGCGLLVVEGVAVPPLFVVTIASAVTLLVVLLVDGSRVRFLRTVYSGEASGFDILPADRFANDRSLAPMVANAGSAAVLVRIEGRVGSYRSAAAEPVAFVAGTETETLRPLLRRRIAATCMLVAMIALAGLATLTHA